MPMQETVEAWVSKMPEQYQKTARQFLKFGVTGTLGAVIDFSTYGILTRVIGWDRVYLVSGYEVIGANLVSVALAILVMFFVNKHWTFRNKSEDVWKQGVQYFSLNGVTFVMNQLLTSWFAFHVPLMVVIFGNLKDVAAKALAIGIILFLNFGGSKFLVFRR